MCVIFKLNLFCCVFFFLVEFWSLTEGGNVTFLNILMFVVNWGWMSITIIFSLSLVMKFVIHESYIKKPILQVKMSLSIWKFGSPFCANVIPIRFFGSSKEVLPFYCEDNRWYKYENRELLLHFLVNIFQLYILKCPEVPLGFRCSISPKPRKVLKMLSKKLIVMRSSFQRSFSKAFSIKHEHGYVVAACKLFIRYVLQVSVSGLFHQTCQDVRSWK